MQTRQFTNHPQVNRVTYGFAEMTLNGQRMPVHSGSANDECFRSLLALLPDRGIGLFVSYNGEGGGDAKWELLQAVLDRIAPTPRPAIVAPPRDFAERHNKYAGSYQSTRVAATTAEKIGALLAPAVTVRVDDGYLLISGLSREPTHWAELEPYVFRQADGQELVAFRADAQSRITHLFQGNLPIASFRRLAWYEALGLHYAILAGCVALFIITLVVAGISWLRRRRERSPEPRPARIARRLALLVSTLFLLFLILFVVSLSDLPQFPTPLTRTALTAALAASVSTVAVVGFAILAWRRGYWRLIGRIHYSVLALGALAFVWWLGYRNLLGYWL
jgi:hypothetical protein